MSTSYSPKIVTNSLVLCLDAVNTKSYPGSGGTWADISGNSYDATLTETDFNGRAIVFDGTNSLCRTTLPAATLDDVFTVCFWFARGSLPTADGATADRIISTNASGGGTKWCVGINNSGNLQFAGSGGADGEPTVSVSEGTYYFCAVVHDTNLYDFFVNDVKEIDGEAVAINASSEGNMSIGCRPAGGDRVFDGAVAWVVAYNRLLSDYEVLQNYDALKGRFGL